MKYEDYLQKKTLKISARKQKQEDKTAKTKIDLESYSFTCVFSITHCEICAYKYSFEREMVRYNIKFTNYSLS